MDSANKDFYENLITSVLAPLIVEISQDGVGNILSDVGGVNFTYDDVTPSISAAVDFFTIASSASSTLAKIGSMEFQGVAANSVLWMDNMYWNGSNFIYRANGYAGGIHIVNGELHFMVAPSGLAGGTVGSFFTIPKPLTLSTTGATFTVDVTVPAEAYGAGWNGSNEAPTKNDVYDKIQTIVSASDGDKGDITVSGGGVTWTIDNGVVTFAKMQAVSANVLLGNDASGTTVEEITCTAAGRALLDDAAASDQRTTLGLGTIATQNANAVAITGGTVLLAVSGNDSNLRSGTLELQGVANGSDLIMGNLYWDGSFFQRRTADYGEALHMIDGEFRFSMVATGATGGNTAYPGTQLLTLTSTGNTSHVDLTVPVEAYGSGWNGSGEVPTKDAVYDKIEALDGEKVDGTPGVKVYRALLTQTGTSAPTATVLENSLGGTVVWARTSTGVYTATLTSAFTVSKTWAIIDGRFDATTDFGRGMITRTSADVMTVQTYDVEVGIIQIAADDVLNATCVEILVYP